MIVVDASLAAKWVIWEADSLAALRFLRKYGRELTAPDLIFVEVAGAIVRRANETKSLRDDALVALDKWSVSWRDHAIAAHRVTQRHVFEAGRLAVEIAHSLKDCIHLVLAIELEADLATCDERFRDRATDVWPRIWLLSDYG